MFNMQINRYLTLILYSGTFFFTLSLAGCSSNSMNDLEVYIKEATSKYKGTIEPLPEIKTFQTYAYQAHGLRDPFDPPFDAPSEPEKPTALLASNPGKGLKPDGTRPREELEGFELDSLRMVGTLEQNGSMWGLVKVPGGVVYRVFKDNYMGQNHGRVNRITEDKIELTEIVPDGIGAWRKRSAILALSD